MHAILLLLEHRKLRCAIAWPPIAGRGRPAATYTTPHDPPSSARRTRQGQGHQHPEPERNGSDPSTALQGHPWLAEAGASVAATKSTGDLPRRLSLTAAAADATQHGRQEPGRRLVYLQKTNEPAPARQDAGWIMSGTARSDGRRHADAESYQDSVGYDTDGF